MTDPTQPQTTTEIIKADIAALEARIASLEAAATSEVHNITQVYQEDKEKVVSTWHKVDNFVYSILAHARNLSAAAAYASVAAFILKLLHG